jgi:hypothetical protein
MFGLSRSFGTQSAKKKKKKKRNKEHTVLDIQLFSLHGALFHGVKKL